MTFSRITSSFSFAYILARISFRINYRYASDKDAPSISQAQPNKKKKDVSIIEKRKRKWTNNDLTTLVQLIKQEYCDLFKTMQLLPKNPLPSVLESIARKKLFNKVKLRFPTFMVIINCKGTFLSEV